MAVQGVNEDLYIQAVVESGSREQSEVKLVSIIAAIKMKL